MSPSKPRKGRPSSTTYRPPFTITPRVLDACAEILRLVGRIESLPDATPKVKLRRRNRVRTVHSTLAIEGAGLEEPQVTAILDGKRVVGGVTEIREVHNVIAAYEKVVTRKPGRIDDLLRAHRDLMTGLIPDAGRLRKGDVGVVQGTRIAHVAPPASQVPRLIEQLLSFVAGDREIHNLVKAAIAHYELEFIHPFSDGNGRIGRLWQHRLLLQVHPIFAHVPVESIVRQKQAAYYAVLGESDRAGEGTLFVEFALGSTLEALAEFVGEVRPETANSSTRLERAREHFRGEAFSRSDYAKLFLALSMPTASRDLRAGVDNGQLVRTGNQATARYRFR